MLTHARFLNNAIQRQSQYCARLVLVLLINIFCYSASTAQTLIPTNRLTLSISPRYNLLSAGVISNDVAPQPISASNTFGGAVSVGYERLTRYGLLFGYDAQLRRQRHDITVFYDLKSFDPRGSIALSSQPPFVRNYTPTVNYFDQRLNIGYERPFGQNSLALRAQVKASLRFTSVFGGAVYNTRETRQTVFYQRDDSTGHQFTTFAIINTNLEADAGPASFHDAGFTLTGYDFYLGIVKPMRLSWLNAVSVGIEYSAARRPGSGEGPLTLLVFSRDNAGRYLGEYDQYIATPRAIGLRVGFSFWK